MIDVMEDIPDYVPDNLMDLNNSPAEGVWVLVYVDPWGTKTVDSVFPTKIFMEEELKTRDPALKLRCGFWRFGSGIWSIDWI